MFKIIVPLFIATSLPLIAQISVGTDDASTTVTTTVTTDTPATPAIVTRRVDTLEPVLDKTAEGIVAELNPGAGILSVIVPESDIAMKFSFNDQTKTVNLASQAVSWADVKLGQSVTVTYFEKAGELVAKNVAFGDPAKLVPVPTSATAVTTTAIIATTPAPVVTEKVTTTTTTTDEEME